MFPMRVFLSLVTLVETDTKILSRIPAMPAITAHLLTRRGFVSSLGTIAASLCAPCILAQSKLERGRVVLAVDGKASFYYLPLTISEQLGYFKAEGLDVDFLDVVTSSRAQQALSSGAADVCAGAFEHTLQMQSKGQAVRSFVLQGRAPQCAFGISKKSFPASAVATDLRGKKVGVPELGSASHLLASTVLARSGLGPLDIAYVVVGSGNGALTALREGQIDALSHTEPVMTTLELRNEVKTISDARTINGAKAVFGGTMPAACLFASDDFLQKAPKTSQALANAVVRGLKWLQTAGTSDIIKTVPEGYLLGDRSLYLAAFNKLRESICLDGLMPEDGPRIALRAISGFDQSIDIRKIDLQKSFTNQFAQRAKERFIS
jgi:NitT/TauT family transport system substrate-binding protein